MKKEKEDEKWEKQEKGQASCNMQASPHIS